MKSLILGFGEGYEIPQLEVFVRSLRETNFSGDAGIFVNRWASHAVEEYLISNGIEPIRVDGLRGLYKYARKLIALQRQLKGTVYTPTEFAGDYRLQHSTMARYAYYRRYLESHAGEYSNVMLTDVRDVMFQDDPFCTSPQHDICLYEEPGPTLGDSGATAKWIRRSYGQDALDQVADRAVLCAGVMTGTYDGMLQLISGLTETMARAKAFWGLRFGLDQASLNCLVYQDINGFMSDHDVKLYSSGTGSIAHLALAQIDRHLDTSLRVVDMEGHTVPTVHQYDRHPDIFQEATRRFASRAA